MALQLDVITPERRLLSEQVDSVTVPGAGGELGILPGHTPLISELQTGVLSYAQGATTRRLLVSGGFVEVNDDRVSVLADLAEFPQEVNAERAPSATKPRSDSARSRARPKNSPKCKPNSTAPPRASNSPRATPHAEVTTNKLAAKGAKCPRRTQRFGIFFASFAPLRLNSRR